MPLSHKSSSDGVIIETTQPNTAPRVSTATAAVAASFKKATNVVLSATRFRYFSLNSTSSLSKKDDDDDEDDDDDDDDLNVTDYSESEYSSSDENEENMGHLSRSIRKSTMTHSSVNEKKESKSTVVKSWCDCDSMEMSRHKFLMASLKLNEKKRIKEMRQKNATYFAYLRRYKANLTSFNCFITTLQLLKSNDAVKTIAFKRRHSSLSNLVIKQKTLSSSRSCYNLCQCSNSRRESSSRIEIINHENNSVCVKTKRRRRTRKRTIVNSKKVENFKIKCNSQKPYSIAPLSIISRFFFRL